MNYFIDCGTHFGQGIQQISSLFKMDSEWKIFTFEANPVTHGIFMREHYSRLKERFPLLESFNTAIADSDGEIDMHLEIPPGEGETGQGSSIIDSDTWQPWGGKLNFREEPVKVASIDFGKWIQSLGINPEDKVIIKLDIEGAEYIVLESMLERGGLENVSEILIEFHHQYFVNSEEMRIREEDIKRELTNRKVNFRLWH